MSRIIHDSSGIKVRIALSRYRGGNYLDHILFLLRFFTFFSGRIHSGYYSSATDE